jgi:hypothetical protein
VQLVLIVNKWPQAKHQPFSRNVYMFGALEALFSIWYLCNGKYGVPMVENETLLWTIDDLAFNLALVGCVLTLGVDFLWALASTTESNPLFNQNISEVDFVLRNWYFVEILAVAGICGTRYLPTSYSPHAVIEWTMCFFLSSFVCFIWFCLYKVKGTSNSKRFHDAFFKASVVNGLLSFIIFAHTMDTVALSFRVEELLNNYILMTHILQTMGVGCILAFFMFLKAPPADLKEKPRNFSTLGRVVQAKTMLKRGLKNRQARQAAAISSASKSD